MKTIAVAARTMDRQKRYQSLLSAGDYAVLPALDCLTLARLAKSRPVDVIIFDLQHPAMSAHDWLTMIDRDPDLTFLPTVWVGRDVLPGIFERIKGLSNSLTITARPDMQTLIHAIKHVFNAARDSQQKLGDTGPIPNVEWQPGEGIIDEALSIFDQPVDEVSSPPKPEMTVPKGPGWHVSEVERTANGHKQDRQENKDDTEHHDSNHTEPAKLPEEPESDNINLKVNVEEVITGKFRVPSVSDHETDGGHHIIPEKIITDETKPQLDAPADNVVPEKTIPDQTKPQLDAPADNVVPEKTIPDQTKSQRDVPADNVISKKAIPDQTKPQLDVPSDNVVPEKTIPDQTKPQLDVPADNVVSEKTIPDQTRPQLDFPVDDSHDLIDHITTAVLNQLAEKLAKELISRINPDMVRRLVEKKMTGQAID